MAIHLGKSATVGLGILAVASTVLTGCTDIGPGINIPATLRTPTIAGVVDDSMQLPDGRRWRYRLGNGQTVDVDYDDTTSLNGGPQLGRLLLWGVNPGGRAWVLGLSAPEWAPECFGLLPPGRENAGWIETNSGYRLRKAMSFHDDRDRPTKEYPGSWRVHFCLNESGEVTSYEFE